MVPMPAGWSTVNKKAFLGSEVAVSLLCATILLFASLGIGRQQYNMVNEKFQSATSSFVKTVTFGYVTVGVGLTFLIACASLALTSVLAVFYSNIDYSVLEIPMPEQEPLDPNNPVDVSLSN